MSTMNIPSSPTSSSVSSGKRSSIKIMVIGDEGVGKSSLISTFVSQQFFESVPGIMTRVQLPIDPVHSCVTTIVDSQGADIAMMHLLTSNHAIETVEPLSQSEQKEQHEKQQQQRDDDQEANGTPTNNLEASGGSSSVGASSSNLGALDHIDSIILVYDVNQNDTFSRLESHWLPLIERSYSGEIPVIVAGNKMDLFGASTATISAEEEEEALTRSRREIFSLMQRFRCIRQWMKCSAKKLLRVNEIFSKAQEAVLFPTSPLYDMDAGRLSDQCKRALTRIFRMYDLDHDGLLSQSEIDRFESETLNRVLVYERDLRGWQKVVSRYNPTNDEVIRDGKFTVAGFLTIFYVFINRNRWVVPWQVLRHFGYDDNLNLNIPYSVVSPEKSSKKGSWALTNSARKFLSDLFHQFDSDHDGILSPENVRSIFSIVCDPSLPPWHPLRSPEVFHGCFSRPKIMSAPGSPPPDTLEHDHHQHGRQHRQQETARQDDAVGLSVSQSLSASGITIVSGDSLPSVDMSAVHRGMYPVSKPLSYLDWMGQWHAISVISPFSTRAELFRLGHVEEATRSKQRRRKKRAVGPNVDYSEPDALLPSREFRILVLGSPGCGKTALLNALCQKEDPLYTSHTKTPETSSTHVKLKLKQKTSSKSGGVNDWIVAHLIFTEVPEAEAESHLQRKQDLSNLITNGHCDLIMLVFDATNSASLAYARSLEATLLTDNNHRVYVGTKGDQIIPSYSNTNNRNNNNKTVVDEASDHCNDLDLEPPLVTNATENMLGDFSDTGNKERIKILEHLARCSARSGPNYIERLKSTPLEEKKRREAAWRRTKRIMWFGVGVGIAVAVVGYLWTRAAGKGGAGAGAGAGGGNNGGGGSRKELSTQQRR